MFKSAKLPKQHILYTLLKFSLALAMMQSITIACWSSPAENSPRLQAVFSKADRPSFYIKVDGMSFGIVKRVSPDKKYVALILCGDGEVGDLKIVPYESKIPDWSTLISLLDISDVNGCIWLPNHAHILAYSSGGADYGRGVIGLWHDSNNNQILLSAKSKYDSGFDILAISHSKKRLIFIECNDHKKIRRINL